MSLAAAQADATESTQIIASQARVPQPTWIYAGDGVPVFA